MDDELIKGTRLLCALDERTCLTCLELDGRDHAPPIPIHDGCRCVVVPVVKSWAELSGLPISEPSPGTRSSAIGQVSADGGLYKDYLIERRRTMQSPQRSSADVAKHLRAWLDLRVGAVRADEDVAASIRAALLADDEAPSAQDLVATLRSIRWNADHRKDLFRACARAGAFNAVDECLARMRTEVPEGPYACRHRGMLFREAAAASKDVSLDRAIRYLRAAVECEPDNVGVLVDLAGLLRRVEKLKEARQALEAALKINPAHKAARQAFARVTGELG